VTETEFQELIKRCLKNNGKAHEQLYRKFYSYGLTVCLHYCHERSEAEDVLQEGFYKVFTNITGFDNERDFKPWLRRILVNSAIDYHRKYHKLNVTDDLTVVEQSSIEYSGLDKLQYDDLLYLLQQLPPQYRLVFNLYEMEGFSHEEIASQLGIGVSTSKSNLSRARQKLRRMVEVYGIKTKKG
jgi:RNA polymerase sigma factor (sigma-70 family)